MKFARCNALTCQQMRTCFKAVHSEMWICPPRDNFRQQLVYHCSTYQITVRFHAFVILLIFFVPGQIQKSLALPHSSSKFWALWKDPNRLSSLFIVSYLQWIKYCLVHWWNHLRAGCFPFSFVGELLPRPEMLFQWDENTIWLWY